MQIMSSPSMSDAADTPVSESGGSPSPQSPLSTTEKQAMDFSKKECTETEKNGISVKLTESTDCGRSENSSPATLVPTPRSTPPMNGILTPPNDVDGNNDSSKGGKPGGRLKFFKDGILCLELTHQSEGERTKWVQIRTKTVIPTLIQTVKEATIPCHSTPSSFASPSSLTHNHRVESSTSHSLSDDASSMLSSPRARESHWKQPVPQRGVSTCLQFYMKPAPCALKVRRKVKEISNSQDQLRKRLPYNYRRTDIFVKLANCVQCFCDDLSHVLKDSSNSSKSRREETNDDEIESTIKTIVQASKIKRTKLRKVSLHKVVEHLEKLAQSQLQNSRESTKSRSGKSNGDSSESAKRQNSGKHNVVTPKKRLFNEVEPKDPANIRPNKKSPNRSHEIGKTILNVPGLNSEFYKRHSSSKSIKNPGRGSPMTGIDVSGYEQRVNKSVSDNAVHKRSNRSPHFGAKSISPGTSSSSNTTLKPGLTPELVDQFSPLHGRSISRISDEHISPRHQSLSSHLQEQKYLQQQTVSKAISYTINSLLGTSAISGGEPVSGQQARTGGYDQIRHSHQRNNSAFLPSSNFQNNQRGSRQNTPSNNNIPSGRPDQDQKSFLRHLLDTSDPIPSVKSVERSSRSSPRPNSAHQTSKSGSLKSAKTNSHNHESPTVLNSANLIPKPVSKTSSQGTHLSTDVLAEAHQSIATNLALSSLMTSFPLNTPYDLLTRGASSNPHSTEALTAAAAAAAALHQYGSLIPGNLFPPVNSTMAAAMASYFGVMPNFPAPAAPKPQSPSPKGSSRRNDDRSQRSWTGMVNGHLPASSPPFRTSSAPPINSQNSPGRSSSAISHVEISSCGALNLSEKKKNLAEDVIDMDAPLDLCKKSSR